MTRCALGILAVVLALALGLGTGSATAGSSAGERWTTAEKAAKQQRSCAGKRSRSCRRLSRCAARKPRKRARRRCARPAPRRRVRRSPAPPQTKVPRVSPLVPAAPGHGGGPALPGSPGTAAPLGRYLSVSAREFSLTLSRPALAAGAVSIELRNLGEDPHNLVVSPDGSHAPLASFAEAPAGGREHETKALDLPAGRYYLWCSLEGHEALGMSARLRVGQ